MGRKEIKVAQKKINKKKVSKLKNTKALAEKGMPSNYRVGI